MPTIKVTYESSLKLGEKFRKNQTFILIGNSNDYYFATYQNYLSDTQQYETNGFDLQAISDYFQERVFKNGSQYDVIFTYTGKKIRYQERQNIEWVLYGDTKFINGVQCQMAATNLFGRRWIAYFAKEYLYNIGPYKFNGLPGLIFELYDSRDDYHFTVSKVEKSNKKLFFNLKPYANFSKEKYLKAKYNLEFDGAGFPPMFGDLKKEYDETSSVLKRMYNNPLEIKP